MTKRNQLLEKHYKRLNAEAVLRSILSGALFGFGANFVAALLAWIFDFGGLLFAAAVGLGVGLATGLALYFLKFKPTEREVARRVDRLGLEERMITMLELDGNESYIAKRQRENARESLATVEDRRIRIRISRLLIVLVSLSVVLGIGMSTVVVLASKDVIPTGPEIFPEDPLKDHIAVTYLAADGGEIEGNPDQLVLPGASTEPVVAVADDGYMFVGWDDGHAYPDRIDENVTVPLVITAMFEEVEESEESDEADDEQGDEEGDEAQDAPQGGTESENQNGEENEGSGSSSDPSDPNEGEDEGKDGSSESTGVGAAGKWENSNQFIDGSTYYRDYLDIYYEMAMQIFAETGEIPPEMRDFFEAYFGSI